MEKVKIEKQHETKKSKVFLDVLEDVKSDPSYETNNQMIGKVMLKVFAKNNVEFGPTLLKDIMDHRIKERKSKELADAKHHFKTIMYPKLKEAMLAEANDERVEIQVFYKIYEISTQTYIDYFKKEMIRLGFSLYCTKYHYCYVGWT